MQRQRHQLTPLDDSLTPATISVTPVIHPEGVPKEPVATSEHPRPHYVATYIDADQLARDNKAMERSSATQKERRILGIRLCGSIIGLVSLVILIMSILQRNSLLVIAGCLFAGTAAGIVLKKRWGVTLLKFIVICMIFGFASLFMISAFVTRGLAVFTGGLFLQTLVVFTVLVCVLAALSEPRTQEMMQ